jgi:hypothetical protein
MADDALQMTFGAARLIGPAAVRELIGIEDQADYLQTRF